MPTRKEKFVAGDLFHIFNKSIASFGIFKDRRNPDRFIRLLDYYNKSQPVRSYSQAIEEEEIGNGPLPNLLFSKDDAVVKFISYIFMPDHYHLVLKILKENYLPKFLGDVQNSFSRHFNIRFKRKGPLWQHRFKAVKVKTNQRLLHLTRYVHLNSTTAGLVENPEDWEFSSYRDIIDAEKNFFKDHLTEISIRRPDEYKKFVDNNKDYQKRLKLIKKLILE